MSQSLSGLSLRDLEYVQAVAELKHFGQAALRCGVSQPALSEQVRKLETHLGVTIFERTKRRVAVTAEGAALLASIERILAEARNLLALGRRGGALAGLLHLGAIETLGPYYLPYLMALLRRDMPDISLRLAENRTAALIERLRHGALDVILAVAGEPIGGLAHTPLFFEPFVLAAPLAHWGGSRASSSTNCRSRTCCCWRKATACASRRWRSAPARRGPPSMPPAWKRCGT
jgi:LysR family hydrogen peroxide-inducible transcriptional activator